VVSWVPTATVASSGGFGSVGLQGDGAGFAVGGVYAFQPEALVLDPPATLVITYTDAAAGGLDENAIQLFRWNPAGNNWLPLAAQHDAANNTFTATTSQLGTFTLGYDATPPTIQGLAPAPGAHISNTLPMVSAVIADAGTGVAPASVGVTLDGQAVPAAFVAGTGAVSYWPPVPLAAGAHTLHISAQDVAGNSAAADATFFVVGAGTTPMLPELWLPMIVRDN
jgi:hypothetical protein